MGIFSGINISGSALTAERLRMDVVSSNMANAETTRAQKVNGEWVPYRRKMVSFSSNNGGFSSQLSSAMGTGNSQMGGVKVSKITEDQTPFKLVYDPTNPDANQEGYVEMPNVDPLKEMVDMMSATRSYEANVTVLNANKSMLTNALQIGK
ncbi:flagellar basal-body rod protein FlgC [Pullulanibacillus pueri]|uniref:Flagellar basal-body rod protein FlgC n=1 Tax=Pullulanibacillus pueri TaxID=1437324 RepID=A0A8J2ZVX0_9BACL|nr:flagellar basal body rod protein FlgC [Pullulanibacillus pueri]MBM7682472.1 flagellar basal-body rod protein FlgC [Pullulanibacillus pueri]GGH82262.1 flagellar basal-body rod protein FlgC [Pullulanibacillus pueri]